MLAMLLSWTSGKVHLLYRHLLHCALCHGSSVGRLARSEHEHHAMRRRWDFQRAQQSGDTGGTHAYTTQYVRIPFQKRKKGRK